MHFISCRSWCEKLASVMFECTAVQDEIRSLRFNSGDRDRLRAARVIGCTATGAAKYKDLLQVMNERGTSFCCFEAHSMLLLQDPAVAPTILMIEEAGELHESLALTSLSSKTKQLIMVRFSETGTSFSLRSSVDS